MADHALLSASSSHRWLNCPPSAKLCAAHPDRASPYAQQGTDAHSLAAYKVQKALGMAARDPTEDLDYCVLNGTRFMLPFVRSRIG